MQTINEPNHPTDYRLVKLMDGSLLIGTISVDDNHMRILNPLELTTLSSYDGVWFKRRYNIYQDGYLFHKIKSLLFQKIKLLLYQLQLLS